MQHHYNHILYPLGGAEMSVCLYVCMSDESSVSLIKNTSLGGKFRMAFPFREERCLKIKNCLRDGRN